MDYTHIRKGIRQGKYKRFEQLFGPDKHQIPLAVLSQLLNIPALRLHYLLRHPEQMDNLCWLQIDHLLQVPDDTTFDLIAAQTRYYCSLHRLRWVEPNATYGFLRKRKRRPGKGR